jgi:hypothetical protein
MVFNSEDQRERLVVELRRLHVRADVIAWVSDPDTDLTALTDAAAVPFWNEILRRVDPWSPADSAAVREPLFSFAVQAYLGCWRTEVEQSELFEAAQILARAAQDHLSTRTHVAD